MDWVRLLDDSNIEHVSRGPNTKRGEISVRCPFCGEDDPSHHLGINLEADKWGCLRNAEHRGNNPDRLVAALLGCNMPRARIIIKQYNKADPSDLDHVLEALGEEIPAAKAEPEVYPLVRQIRYRGATQRFWNYLKHRGFGDDVRELVWRYGLQACLTGRFKDRIIIPFRRNGKVIAWTGRAIADPVNAPRYLSSGAVKSTVFNEDVLIRGGHLLFIVEGPFDALKLDYYAGNRARATCTFGTVLSLDQIAILRQGLKNFSRVVLLFDRDAFGQAFAAMDWLMAPNVVVGSLPPGAEDPGGLSPQQIITLTQEAAQ
jgi:hypothetical protein